MFVTLFSTTHSRFRVRSLLSARYRCTPNKMREQKILRLYFYSNLDENHLNMSISELSAQEKKSLSLPAFQYHKRTRSETGTYCWRKIFRPSHPPSRRKPKSGLSTSKYSFHVDECTGHVEFGQGVNRFLILFRTHGSLKEPILNLRIEHSCSAAQWFRVKRWINATC